ncbi:MAG: sugar phosphate nucleotidyltransferase [bacterium]|nr:sugar phosphate nucleotidyltransferase [bacterium]
MGTYAVILAGGNGTRLWPLSRRSAPKQVHALLDEETMLQKTYARARQRFAPDAIIVATTSAHAASVREQLPELPVENLLEEPLPRGTAAALGLAAVSLVARDCDARFVTMHSDAYVADDAQYHVAIETALAAAERPDVDAALVGVAPTYAETGYGYIEMADVAERADGTMALPVTRFVEKPERVIAEQYVESGRYLWNLGLFSFRAQKLLSQIAVHLPDHHAAFRNAADVSDRAAWTRAFLSMSSVSIDVGIVERLAHLVVVPASFGWADVGNWRAVHDILTDSGRATPRAIRATHVGLQGDGNLVVAPEGKLIATYGMRDCVIIDTEDALLICPRERAQHVREVVLELERRGMTEYL